MIPDGAMAGADWRRAFLALAFLCVALRALAPPGMMVAPADGTGRAAFPLVICTGHGPVVAAANKGHEAPVPKSRSDAPCVFAAHAVVLAAQIGAPPPASPARPTVPPLPGRGDLAPGRGLAAPPPPSQAPPGSLL
jgi:hypothetical protein